MTVGGPGRGARGRYRTPTREDQEAEPTSASYAPAMPGRRKATMLTPHTGARSGVGPNAGESARGERPAWRHAAPSVGAMLGPPTATMSPSAPSVMRKSATRSGASLSLRRSALRPATWVTWRLNGRRKPKTVSDQRSTSAEPAQAPGAGAHLGRPRRPARAAYGRPAARVSTARPRPLPLIEVGKPVPATARAGGGEGAVA